MIAFLRDYTYLVFLVPFVKTPHTFRSNELYFAGNLDKILHQLRLTRTSANANNFSFLFGVRVSREPTLVITCAGLAASRFVGVREFLTRRTSQ